MRALGTAGQLFANGGSYRSGGRSRRPCAFCDPPPLRVQRPRQLGGIWADKRTGATCLSRWHTLFDRHGHVMTYLQLGDTQGTCTCYACSGRHESVVDMAQRRDNSEGMPATEFQSDFKSKAQLRSSNTSPPSRLILPCCTPWVTAAVPALYRPPPCTAWPS